MSRLAQLILVIILALYPLAVYFGIQYLSLGGILVVLFVVAIMRVVLSDARGKPGTKMVAMALLAVIGFSWLRGDPEGLLWYPVLCNLILLAVFAYSLRQPQSIIERLARLKEPDLSGEGIAYTRKVTKVWCIFFLVNGAVATVTVLNGDMQIWALYNGLFSYVLMGFMMGSEWLLRRQIRSQV